MLRFFAKFQRSRNVILLVFSLLLLVSLALFYIPNSNLMPGNSTANTKENDIVIAKVGSQEVKLKELRNMMAMLAQRFGTRNQLPLSTLKALGLDKEALDSLIANRLAVDLAGNLNLTGTDREVNDEVIRANINPETGQFVGKEEYFRRLAETE